jgi:RNA polymerase sigma factor (TIGR02999 family)
MTVSSSPPHEVSQLLIAWGNGDKAALDQLMPLVYEELRRLARHYMSRERPGDTLQPTALVNEAYLRLVDQEDMRWENRAHFFGIAARIMRQVLVDRARARNAAKRGGGDYKLDLTDISDLPDQGSQLDVLALDHALDGLASFDPQQSRIVELKFFGGLSIEETAVVIGVSPATVKREWALAKSWLFLELSK